MSSVTYTELVTRQFHHLVVPQFTEGMSIFEAAKAWAKSGFYVLPIRPKTKHAGSVLGAGWPEKSSREVETLRSWFELSDYGLAVHVGKSGAIVFDVDNPSSVPARLRAWMEFEQVPFQSTRPDEPCRGHYMFAAPRNRTFSNSVGGLGNGWGEVRGKNGIIVVAPSLHLKASEGASYRWLRTGIVPYLPVDLEEKLPDADFQNLAAVDLSEVENFFARYERNLFPTVLDQRLEKALSHFSVGSRHDSARNLLVVCLREAMAGLYPAKQAVERIAQLFVTYKPREQWTSPDEFLGMVRWAVAQASATSDTDLEHILTAQRIARGA